MKRKNKVLCFFNLLLQYACFAADVTEPATLSENEVADGEPASGDPDSPGLFSHNTSILFIAKV